MRSFVEFVVAFYLFICVALMLFNIFYILQSSLSIRRRDRRVARWAQVVSADFVLSDSQTRKLRRINNLTAFHAAISSLELGRDDLRTFFCNNALHFQELALAYKRKEVMERAFMAYFVAEFHCPDAPNTEMLTEIMLSYLDGSTVFCRENVLQALYALGSSRALEHAFDIFNQNRWYHSPKLVADGMANFTGDKDELALRLWGNHDHWQESLNVATVQFATYLPSDCVMETFCDALQDENVTPELRFALVRYFGRHSSERAHAILLDNLREGGDLAIVAASVLANYPSQETKSALKQALTSRNWYVRHNAAQSLVRIGLAPRDVRDIRDTNDRYAYEMLVYVCKHQGIDLAKLEVGA